MRGKSLIIQTNRHLSRRQLLLAAGLSLITVIVSLTLYNSVNAEEQGRVLLSVYDDGVKTSFTTDQTTVESALAQRGITVHQQDRIEPALNEELSATHYSINIYRSRPILIEDGVIRERIMSSGQTASAIASDAGLHIYDEDITLIKNSSNTAEDGVATSLVVSRAKLITVDFFGKITEFRTQANTVGEFLQEKTITLTDNDGMSLPSNSPIVEGSEFRIWRNGKQTITVDEEIEFEVEKIHDADKPVGYREIKTPGEQGKKTVTYEVLIENGEEVSRQEITSVTTLEPKKQVEVIGMKQKTMPYTGGGTKSEWLAASNISPEDYGYADWLVSRESTWNPNAVNPISGACGLGQQLPCGKWAGQWNNPVDSLSGMDGYVKSRYGSWAGAVAHSQSVGWY